MVSSSDSSIPSHTIFLLLMVMEMNATMTARNQYSDDPCRFFCNIVRIVKSLYTVCVYWEVRLKPPNIALSLALHWLPENGTWSPNLCAVWLGPAVRRGGLICLWGPGVIIDSPASTQAVSPSNPFHFISSHWLEKRRLGGFDVTSILS